MKRKVSFFLVLAVSILCGVVACPKIQIPLEERPPQQKAQQEKEVQEKAIPQEAPQQKAIQKEDTQQEAAQKEITHNEPTQKEITQKEGSTSGIFRRAIPRDTFTRVYAIDFGSFYGQANAALQDHARTHKGNSFRVSRIGSDAVILRGVYLREGGQEKYVSILTIKPIASGKSQLEIKFDSSAENPSSPNPDAAAKEIFQIIDKAAGKAAQ